MTRAARDGAACDAVVIWRSSLLLASETFVRNHGAALRRWRPTFVGATKVDSNLAAPDDVIAFAPTARGRLGFLRLRVTGASPALTRVLTRVRPAVVHAHFGGDGWLVSRAAAGLGVPLVVTLHGYDVTRQPARVGVVGARYRRNLRTVFGRARLVLAVSEFIRDRAVALGADPDRVRVHYTGVPMPPVPAPAVPAAWDIAFVGRLVAKKGVDDLLEAVGGLPEPRPRTLLIGDGPLAGSLRARAAELGLDATFLGQQPPAVVARQLERSRIFVAPSRTAADGETEGLPTTVLEAASLGLPAVSTVHAGIPEAVVDGETGLLGREGDRAGLARNIARLLADDDLRTRLGRQARRRVEARFDLDTQTRALEDLYDAVVRPDLVRRANLP
jgi:colanic acid/amylovoran biosynthesis glycosyltransferase